MLDLNLQRFAEEEAQESAETTDTQEAVAEEPQTEEEAKEPIPDELAGIPEDIARETMAKAQAEQSDEKKDEAEEETEDVTDVQDTVTKPVDAPLKQPNQKIPYARFKQQVDKTNELEEQLKRYQARFGDINAAPQAQPQQSAQPTAQQPVQQPQPPTFQLTDDNMQLIQQAAQEGALQMTGMTKDDLAEFEYSDDNDPKKQRYQMALGIAKNNIMTGLQRAAAQQQAAQAQLVAIHNASVADFNSFVQQESAAQDFKDVQSYAINEYFDALPDAVKPIIAGSWERIQRDAASPAEILAVKNYFQQAKASYHSKHPQKKRSVGAATSKMKQAAAMPRAGQVDGSSGDDGAVTNETLARMLRETPWDKIPDSYKNLMLGIG